MAYDGYGNWIGIQGAFPALGGWAKGRNAQKGRADWLRLRGAIEDEMRQTLTDVEIRKNLGYLPTWRVTEKCRAAACRSIAERALKALVSGMRDGLLHDGLLKIEGFGSFEVDLTGGKPKALIRDLQCWYRYDKKRDKIKTATRAASLVFSDLEPPSEVVLWSQGRRETHFMHHQTGQMVPFERDIAVPGGWRGLAAGVRARITTTYADATEFLDIGLLSLVVVIRCRWRQAGNGDWDLIGTFPAGQRAALQALYVTRREVSSYPFSDWPMYYGDNFPEAGRDVSAEWLIANGHQVTTDEVPLIENIAEMQVRYWPRAAGQTEAGAIHFQRRWNLFKNYPFSVVEAALIDEFEYVKVGPYYCQVEIDGAVKMLEEGMYPAWVNDRPDDEPPEDEDPPPDGGEEPKMIVARKTKPRVRARFAAAFRREIRW